MYRTRKKISRRDFLRISGQAAWGLAVTNVSDSTISAIGQERSASNSSGRVSTHGAISLGQQSNGSEIWQVTTKEFRQSNIYCEIPYCSGDSRFFVYERRNPKLSGGNKIELMVVELGTWKQYRLDVTIGMAGSAISHDGLFYYLKQTEGNTLDLMQANLSKGMREKIYQIEDKRDIISFGTVSTDGRYYAFGKRLGNEYKMFSIQLIDLQKGKTTIIDSDPFILNPHPQFEPGRGRELMIQHNRGGKYTPEGNRIQLVGPEGATLYLLSVPDGERTELQVGKPYTTPATGHEAWIGETGEILLTVMAEDDYEPDKGNLLAVRVGESARVVAKGYRFNHVGVSRCGRFFCCDDWQGTAKLVIGSISSGKTAVVCESKASRSSAQNTHPHAYLTPDLKWVIFNSDRNGFPHVHVASVPDSMIEELSTS
jgi:hypothetical protein